MPLDNLISKEPKQFEYFHRMMGYIMLSLVVVVYHYTQPDTQYQIYIPVFFFFLLLITPKLSHWLIYRYSNRVKRSVLFLIDIVIISVMLSAVHLSLVLTFLAIFALLYTSIYNKINFLLLSLASLIGIAVFYICNIYVFGFQEYFEATSSELTVSWFYVFDYLFWCRYFLST